MSGLTNLEEVLATLQVTCNDIAYGIATVSDETEIDHAQILGSFRESEGFTVFATVDYLKNLGLQFERSLAMLTIEAHTSLELVGLTAALAARLTDAGISANVVAAYFHDHIFVQYNRRTDAIQAIESLRGES